MSSEAGCAQVCVARSPRGRSPHRAVSVWPSSRGCAPPPRPWVPPATRGPLAPETPGRGFPPGASFSETKSVLPSCLHPARVRPLHRARHFARSPEARGPAAQTCCMRGTRRPGPTRGSPPGSPSCLAAVCPEQAAGCLLAGRRPRRGMDLPSSQATRVPLPSPLAPPPGSPPWALSAASGQRALPVSVSRNPDPALRVQTCLRRLLACGRKLLVPGGAVVWDVSGPFLFQGTVAAYTLTRKFQDPGDGPDTEGPPGPPGCGDTCTRSAGGRPPRRWGGGLLHPPAPRRQCTSDSCPGGDPGPTARLRSGPEPRAHGTLRDPRGALPLRRPGPWGQSRPEGSGEASSSLR